MWLFVVVSALGRTAVAADYNPCTDFSEHFALDPARAKLVVVVGYFTRGRYLRDSEGISPGPPPPPSDDGLEAVCINFDPNPMRVQLQITQVLHGELRVKSVWAVTTAHFGLQRIPFGRDKRVIAYVHTDGVKAWIPRYGYPELQQTTTGSWVLPIREPGDFGGWFPCGLAPFIEPMSFARPFSGFRPTEDDLEYYQRLAKDNPHLEFKDGIVRWLSGVQIANVAKILAAEPPTRETIGCKRQ